MVTLLRKQLQNDIHVHTHRDGECLTLSVSRVFDSAQRREVKH